MGGGPRGSAGQGRSRGGGEKCAARTHTHTHTYRRSGMVASRVLDVVAGDLGGLRVQEGEEGAREGQLGHGGGSVGSLRAAAGRWAWVSGTFGDAPMAGW